MSNANENIETVDMENLEDILGIPGTDSIITEEKPNMFASGEVDMSFLNEKEPEPTSAKKESKEESAKKSTEESKEESKEEESGESIDDILEDIDEDGEGVDSKSVNNVDPISKLVEENYLALFDGEKELKDYTSEEMVELIKANVDDKLKAAEEKLPGEFFESLPQELQYAAKYVANGGTDLKSLFSHLAQSQEVKQLSLDNEEDHEKIIREYFKAKDFGTPEEIEEEITSLKDLERLSVKAKQFKPKLDALKEKIIAKKIEQQEASRASQIEAQEKYTKTIFDTLSAGDLNGIKLDADIQNMLYDGLVKADYQSVSGRNTNLFGHLIEKHQFKEPNPSLIAEALWLLKDPEGYKEKIKNIGSTKEAEKVLRKLKIEENNKKNTNPLTDAEDSSSRKRVITKGAPKRNFFAR